MNRKQITSSPLLLFPIAMLSLLGAVTAVEAGNSHRPITTHHHQLWMTN
jgi:hypothetical protein